MSTISIVIPTYNEEENVENIANATIDIFKSSIPKYNYEIIFIDNGSSDKTIEKIKDLCSKKNNIKLIVNIKNYGQLISPYHGMLQATGDAIIPMVCDFQDPPEVIPSLVKKWEEGNKIVLAVPEETKKGYSFFKKVYYKTINFFAHEKQIPNFHSYGIYDKVVQKGLIELNDKNPYFRGQILELNFDKKLLYYKPGNRLLGKSTNNFFSLYAVAIEGIVSSSIVPFRLISLLGLGLSSIIISLLVLHFFLSILNLNVFYIGDAMWLIALLLLSSVQFFFIGLIGEYLLSNQFKNRNNPLVVEKERVNFD